MKDDDNTQTHFVLVEGTMVGHYRIIEKIGAGGMGEVYLAEDAELDRKVALKFLPPHLCQDDDCRARFKREAQAAAKLSHPNIVTIFEVGEFRGRPFFAMEHIEGRSLRDMKGEELELDRIVGIVIQLCDGLQTAHAADVIHRDIKPSNIVIDSNGRPKILDFGLATVKGGEHLTKTGSTLGTVGYMSPEQIEGKRTDACSDLFSLGIVFYELITNKSPFRRDDETATLKAILQDTPEPLARYKSGVPDDLQRISTKLLEKDPALRYQSAAGVIPDLKKVSPSRTSGIRFERRRSWWAKYRAPVAATLVSLILAVWYFGERESSERIADDGRIMLAVLPFENLGNAEDDYFADGITDEINTKLSGLSGLGVISRASAIQYKNTTKSLREIGKDLGVEYVLQGTIRWNNNGGESRVRINPQLIAVNDDLNLWTNSYDAVLNDIFEVQSRIAREIASALDISLLQSEQKALSSEREIDPEAYDYYLRGKQQFTITGFGQTEAEMEVAKTFYLRAIELAPDFVSPYTELSMLYTDMHWHRMDTSEQMLDSARALVDIAMELSPDSPEPYQALGWYYYHGLRDFEHSFETFSRVLELQPNNALAIASIAWVDRRKGNWSEAIEGLRRATQLDPRNAWYHFELGITYLYTRQLNEALSSLNRNIDLQPTNAWAYIMKSIAQLSLTGNPDSALEFIDDGLQFIPNHPSLKFMAAYCHLCARRYDSALAHVTSPQGFYSNRIKAPVDYYIIKSSIYTLKGQSESARPYLDSALTESRRKVEQAPDNPAFQSGLASAYALLGEKDQAIAAGKRAVELLPVSADALDGPDYLRDLTSIYAWVGESDLALDQLETLLSIPSMATAKWAAIAPELLSLHDNPRFKALLQKYDGDQSGI